MKVGAPLSLMCVELMFWVLANKKQKKGKKGEKREKNKKEKVNNLPVHKSITSTTTYILWFASSNWAGELMERE